MLIPLSYPPEAAELDTPWYAIYTRHNHEKSAAQSLASKGLETFLPLYETARRWNDRTKVLSLPLFPCYVFIKGGLDRRLDIVTTPGFCLFVSVAGQPAAIPTREIDAIRQAVQSGLRVDPHPFLKEGEQVRVTRGALAGAEGILVRKKNAFRLVISIEMLGKAVAVEVDGFLIEKISASSSEARLLRGKSYVEESDSYRHPNMTNRSGVIKTNKAAGVVARAALDSLDRGTHR